MIAVEHLRLLVVSAPEALPWRWDLAQLQLGCRDGWPQPGTAAWAARAKELAGRLRNGRGCVALAFEGYTLVGAAWSWDEGGSVARHGPYLMPQYRDPRMEAWLAEAIRAPQARVSRRQAAPAASTAK